MITHLIIGGTTKSGTTSLYQYLADHPQVCGSSMKETRYFLDLDYPLVSAHRYTSDTSQYFDYFSHRGNKNVLMEATPDYLYGEATPHMINKALQQVQLIFILRNPVERFISWFKFSKQRGLISQQDTLGDFLSIQNFDSRLVQHQMVLQQGLYSIYLLRYLKIFGGNNIHVCFLEDLEANPHRFMTSICEFAKIDPTYYSTYDFKIHNPTFPVKNHRIHKQYTRLSYLLRRHTHSIKPIHSLLKLVKKVLQPIYLKVNQAKKNESDMPQVTIEKIRSYYEQELEHYSNRYLTILKNP